MMATCKPETGESASSEDCPEASAGSREGSIGTTGEATGNAGLLSIAFGDSMGLSSLRREETVLLTILKPSSAKLLLHKLLCAAKSSHKKFFPASPRG